MKKLSTLQQQTLDKLIALIITLYQETESFLENTHDEQLWYTRGYATGMIRQLNMLGYEELLRDRIVQDPADAISGQELLSWGKAYLHGVEMGGKETLDVIGPLAED